MICEKRANVRGPRPGTKVVVSDARSMHKPTSVEDS